MKIFEQAVHDERAIGSDRLDDRYIVIGTAHRADRDLLIAMAEELQAGLSDRELPAGRGSLNKVWSGAREKPPGENRKSPGILARSVRFDKLIQIRSGRHLKSPGLGPPR